MKEYKWLTIYFIIFSNLLLVTGVGLYFLEVKEFGKSVEGIIEIVTPHIFSMLLMIFIVGHLLLFKDKKRLWLTIFVMLLSIIINFGHFFDSQSIYVVILFIFTVSFSLLLYFLTVSF